MHQVADILGLTDQEQFEQALSDIAQAWPALKPPNHVRITEGASAILKLARPGSAPVFWSTDETPYMEEPINTLSSRIHSAVCFVGPSQSGKTAGFGEAWMSHNVINDPGDMLIVQMTQDKAREYSKQRVDRALQNSPRLAEMLGRSNDDNTHDKLFRNGMWLKIAWPTGTNLASTSYRYAFGTDYDRWPDDIDGEGDGFTQMGARVTTFLSRGMVAVESSPGRPLNDPHWKPATPHEGPPVTGICGIYNRGDRRRQYWQCPHCRMYFQAEPGLKLFGLPEEGQLLEDIRTIDIGRMAEQYARVICPNGCLIDQDFKHSMNLGGRWLQDGLTIDEHGRISGTPRTSSIASFWLGGVAAAYARWESLLNKYLQALLEYKLTGSELPLQTTINTNQAMPYISRRIIEQTKDVPLRERKAEGVERYVVPDDTRCLLAAVDIQGGRNARFEVSVHAISPNGKETPIDRYSLRRSKRPGIGNDEFAPIDPASYAEDWDILTEKVVYATYRTSIACRELKVLAVAVDSGGEDGVTDKAYAWKRRLRQQGLSQFVYLVKGDPKLKDVMFRETWVGAKAGVKGDVPLLLLNSDKIKDVVDASLRRTDSNGSHYVFGEWLNDAYFDELEGEIRQSNGSWKKIKRNESFDLCAYIKALQMVLRIDRVVDWEQVPEWLAPLEANSNLVERRLETEDYQAPEVPKVEVVYERQVSRSSYMR